MVPKVAEPVGGLGVAPQKEATVVDNLLGRFVRVPPICSVCGQLSPDILGPTLPGLDDRSGLLRDPGALVVYEGGNIALVLSRDFLRRFQQGQAAVQPECYIRIREQYMRPLLELPALPLRGLQLGNPDDFPPIRIDRLVREAHEPPV